MSSNRKKNQETKKTSSRKRAVATAAQPPSDAEGALSYLMEHPREHEGARVVTLEEIDRVHGRPSGTAGRAFRKVAQEQADVFRLATHYHLVDRDTMRPLASSTKFVDENRRAGGRALVLITERGYLMIVKTFHDKLAWKIQDRLVESYFAVEGLVQLIVPRGYLEALETRVEHLENGIVIRDLEIASRDAFIAECVSNYGSGLSRHRWALRRRRVPPTPPLPFFRAPPPALPGM